MKITKNGLQRLVSIAQRKNKLEDCLRTLPNVGMTAVKSSAYYQILNASAAIEKAAKWREEQIAVFVDQLLKETPGADGWTREELFKALDTQ